MILKWSNLCTTWKWLTCNYSCHSCIKDLQWVENEALRSAATEYWLFISMRRFVCIVLYSLRLQHWSELFSTNIVCLWDIVQQKHPFLASVYRCIPLAFCTESWDFDIWLTLMTPVCDGSISLVFTLKHCVFTALIAGWLFSILLGFFFYFLSVT